MRRLVLTCFPRAERRAAPKPARAAAEGRPLYSADGGRQ